MFSEGDQKLTQLCADKYQAGDLQRVDLSSSGMVFGTSASIDQQTIPSTQSRASKSIVAVTKLVRVKESIVTFASESDLPSCFLGDGFRSNRNNREEI